MHGRRERFNPVGVVGLGLLGRGIATCLLAQGFEVVAYEQIRERAKASPQHVAKALVSLVKHAILPRSRVKNWQQRLSLAQSLAQLGDCAFVIEAVSEDLDLKQGIYEELEAAVSPRTIIASNTSGLPITALQAGRKHPERFVGMNCGEPAEVLRYLETIPGKRTSLKACFQNLYRTKSFPKTMRNMVSRGALGISNRKGFYKYNRSSAKAWEKTWLDFTPDLRKLLEKYKQRGA